MATSWQDVKDLVRELIGDDESDQVFFSAAQILAWGQQCLEDMARRTHYVDIQTTGVTVADTQTYTAGDKAFQVYRVEVDNRSIDPIRTDQLRYGDDKWRNQTGRPDVYFLDELDLTAATPLVGMFPVPSGVYTTRIFSYGFPEDISDSSSTDNVPVPSWAVSGVWLYILARAYEADTVLMDLGLTSFYQSLYEEVVGRLGARSYSRLNKVWGGSANEGVRRFSRIPDTPVTP